RREAPRPQDRRPLGPAAERPGERANPGGPQQGVRLLAATPEAAAAAAPAAPRPGVRPRHVGPVRLDRVLRAGAPLAGPILIVVAVLVVYHDVAFGGRLTNQHEDVLGLTMPTYCFLGSNLAAGHIPLWNPSSLAGLPFAADPQSGWAYLPAMLLFAAMGCGAAMRWYVVLQPMLAGLGLYWFLRS